MTFWGRVINQRNPYDHGRHTHDGRLRITKATLGLPSKGQSTNEKVVLLCKKGNSAPIRLCVLFPEKVETQSLELEFEWNEEVVISVSGNHNVSLLGYYNGRRTHFRCNEDDSDTLGEDIAETESKESSDYDSDEDDYDSMDSFINDSDPEKLTSSPEPKKKTKGGEPQSERMENGTDDSTCSRKMAIISKVSSSSGPATIDTIPLV